MIDIQGRVAQVNHLTTVSWHVHGHNLESIGICLEGNLDEMPPSPDQDEAVEKLVRGLYRHEGLQKTQIVGNWLAHTVLEIKGHRELSATTCPGRYGGQAVEWLRKL